MTHMIVPPNLHKNECDLVALARKIPMPVKKPEHTPQDTKEPEEQTAHITPEDIQDPQNYIILPGDHPNILVPAKRQDLTAEVEKALNDLKIYSTLKERAGKDGKGDPNKLNPNGYLGYMFHKEAQKLASRLNSFILPAHLYADFLQLLINGIESKAKVYYASGIQVPSSSLTQIFNDITEVRSPYRAEYLDDSFTSVKKGRGKSAQEETYIKYHKFNSQGSLVEVAEELDPDTLMKDKTSGIDLRSWLNNRTSQGWPANNVQNGALYYWHPVAGSVAWVVADSGGADLDGYGDPQCSVGGLGVRLTKIIYSKHSQKYSTKSDKVKTED